jgi:hypothetical protein
MAENGVNRVLNAYLAEYNSLRAEQLSRLQSQNQAFNYLVIILGAAIGAVITSLSKPEQMWLWGPILIALGLFLPLVSGPLGFIFFDNEMAIYSIGSRIYTDLRPHIGKIITDTGVFEDSLTFKNLNPSGPKIHRRLSAARWILFLVPTVLPTLGVGSYVITNWAQWWSYLKPSAHTPLVTLYVFGGAIFIIDILTCVLLLQAIWWSFRKFSLPG